MERHSIFRSWIDSLQHSEAAPRFLCRNNDHGLKHLTTKLNIFIL